MADHARASVYIWELRRANEQKRKKNTIGRAFTMNRLEKSRKNSKNGSWNKNQHLLLGNYAPNTLNH